tara:strand:+ start:264 stop:1043 length:780 start_codon:yes stop_codon:yes gene_type:complete
MEEMKAHQRIIRENKSTELSGDLFGNYWESIDLNISNSEVKAIDYQTAKKIILEYEWLGTMGTTQFHYGLYFDGHLAGVTCFGYFQAMNTNSGGHPYAPYVGSQHAKKGIQLSRGACVHWAHEHSGSKLISQSLKCMNEKGYKYAIAFSDPEAGEIGTLYQATNWYYLGFAKSKHYDVYRKTGQLYMNDRDFHKKHGFSGKEKLDAWVKDKPHLCLRLRKPKGRYIFLMGNKKDRKEMWKVLEHKVKPYPKRLEAENSQ